MKIRYKLIFYILSSVFVVSVCMIYLSYASSRHALVAEIETNAKNMLERYRARINGDLDDIEDIALSASTSVESAGEHFDENDAKSLIKQYLKYYPDIYGSAISFVPGSFGNGKKLFAPYYHRGSGEAPVYVDLATESYYYPKWDWFKTPIETGKPYWTRPYYDEGGGDVAMVTYAMPFFKNGKAWGVVGVDLSLRDLTKEVDSIKVGMSGFAFLLDDQGMFLTLRHGDKNFKKTVFDAARENNSPQFEKLGRDMISGKEGFVSMMNPLLGKQSWFVYGSIPATKWSVAIVLPEDELLQNLYTLHTKIIVIAIVGMLVIFAVVFFVSSKIGGPISLLAGAAKKIAGGDFETEIKVPPSKDEVGMLAKAFSEMKWSLGATLQQLKEEKEMFSVAFTNMTDGFVILDVNCNILQYNKAAERLLMLPAEGSLKEHLSKHFEGKMPDECSAVFKLSRRETKDLGTLHIECTIIPIFDDNKQLKEHVLNVRNITEQESEERSKRDFLSLMSHKLFTPLTVLQGKLMLMKDGLAGPLEEKQKKLVDSMADQTSKLNDLIGSLVNFVSLEESRFDTSKESIEPESFLRLVADECKNWYADKNPEITVNIFQNTGSFMFNKKYLSLIVKQLVENGIKFNMSVPPKVDLVCKKDGGFVVIRATDNGIGIPPEFTDKIFDKFFQIEKYYTGNVEGVGLGLTFVKKIVDAFNGKIEVESIPGKGSIFTVKLPT